MDYLLVILTTTHIVNGGAKQRLFKVLWRMKQQIQIWAFAWHVKGRIEVFQINKIDFTYSFISPRFVFLFKKVCVLKCCFIKPYCLIGRSGLKVRQGT